MTIEQLDKVDFASIDTKSGDLWLSISDHLPWDIDESSHLFLLQEKVNAYLRFIESGEMNQKIPQSKGLNVVIDLVGKYKHSAKAEWLLGKIRMVLEKENIRMQIRVLNAPDTGT